MARTSPLQIQDTFCRVRIVIHIVFVQNDTVLGKPSPVLRQIRLASRILDWLLMKASFKYPAFLKPDFRGVVGGEREKHRFVIPIIDAFIGCFLCVH